MHTRQVRNSSVELFFWKIPPFKFFQKSNRLFVKAVLDNTHWISDCDSIRWNIFCNSCFTTDSCKSWWWKSMEQLIVPKKLLLWTSLWEVSFSAYLSSLVPIWFQKREKQSEIYKVWKGAKTPFLFAIQTETSKLSIYFIDTTSNSVMRDMLLLYQNWTLSGCCSSK